MLYNSQTFLYFCWWFSFSFVLVLSCTNLLIWELILNSVFSWGDIYFRRWLLILEYFMCVDVEFWFCKLFVFSYQLYCLFFILLFCSLPAFCVFLRYLLSISSVRVFSSTVYGSRLLGFYYLSILYFIFLSLLLIVYTSYRTQPSTMRLQSTDLDSVEFELIEFCVLCVFFFFFSLAHIFLIYWYASGWEWWEKKREKSKLTIYHTKNLWKEGLENSSYSHIHPFVLYSLIILS